MTDLKRCQRCGKIISDDRNGTADYFRHISVKWCDECRPLIERAQAAERMKKLRTKRKLYNKKRDERIALLEEENELLRKNILKLREQLL